MTTTLDWYGCATFALKTAGLNIFLDAYIDRAANAPGSGLKADDIDACDWIVVGHSHFDHLYGAERIAVNTGAKIIGSYETVRVMEQAGVYIDLGNGVTVSVYPSQHSCVWSHAEMHQPGEVCIGDLGVTWQEQNRRMGELMDYLSQELEADASAHVASSLQGDRGDGGALIFVFETPDGSVLFQDTSGHWSGILRDLRPDVAIMAAAGRFVGGIHRPAIRPAAALEADPVSSRQLVAGIFRGHGHPAHSRCAATGCAQGGIVGTGLSGRTGNFAYIGPGPPLPSACFSSIIARYYFEY